MILGVHHLAIQCADLGRCERFYREVLGLDLLRRWPREDGAGDRSVWLAIAAAPGTPFLALEQAGAPAEPRAWGDGTAGLHLVALRIEPADRQGWEQRLAAAGVEVVHRTRWTIYVRDPEGNRVGLSHHPEEPSAAPPGRRGG